jgi:hypothetical protein
MNELKLYKFINENNIEYHTYNDETMAFINIQNLEEWNELLGSGITDEYGLDCIMKNGYFCFNMNQICEYFGIELINVFKLDAEGLLEWH